VRVDETCVEVRGAFVFGPPKTVGSRREIDLPRVTIRPLAEHLLAFPPLRSDDPELAELVFYGERKGPVRRHVFRPIWRDACAAAKVEPIRLEWLRHTGASIAYAATRDLKATAARLGHTNTRMVDDVYVRLYAETSRSVADAIDAAIEATRSR
jgi:integrase